MRTTLVVVLVAVSNAAALDTQGVPVQLNGEIVDAFRFELTTARETLSERAAAFLSSTHSADDPRTIEALASASAAQLERWRQSACAAGRAPASDDDGDARFAFSSPAGFHAAIHCRWRFLLDAARAGGGRAGPSLWAARAARAVRVLELGVLEGRSAAWFVESLLAHPRSVYVGVDAAPARASANLRAAARAFVDGAPDLALLPAARASASPRASVSLLEGRTVEALAALLHERHQRGAADAAGALFDVIYVDADHSQAAVLLDVQLSWQLLAVGGVLICDDYFSDAVLNATGNFDHIGGSVRRAVDAFVDAHRGEMRILLRGDELQFAAMKLK